MIEVDGTDDMLMSMRGECGARDGIPDFSTARYQNEEYSGKTRRRDETDATKSAPPVAARVPSRESRADQTAPE